MTGYDLSRDWWDFCFENPEKITPSHSAIYFFAIEHCNRLGWKMKFGFPTQMAMDAIGIKKHQTYIKYFNEIVEWKFFKLIQKSTNQYSANIISLQTAMPKKVHLGSFYQTKTYGFHNMHLILIYLFSLYINFILFAIISTIEAVTALPHSLYLWVLGTGLRVLFNPIS